MIARSHRGSQLPFDFYRNQSATFAAYFPAANAETAAALQSLAVHPQRQSTYLWGGQGTGKTHLLQALCQAAAEADKSVAYLPIAAAAAYGASICEGLEMRDVICIDDVDAVAGEEDWERALFALYNAAQDEGRTLVMSGRTAPRESAFLLADLRSRLQWCLVYQLQPLSEQQKRALLGERAGQRGLVITDEVAEYVLRRFPRDVGSLCALIERLDQASLSAQRHVTIPFVRELLGSLE